jgi:hypothetical protein
MTLKTCLAALALTVALTLGALRCGHDVQLGVDPATDAAATNADAGTDG